MICVLPGLYLGSASDAADVQRLQEAGITHVLTVDSEAPNGLDGFITKFVHLLDDASADLLSCLPACTDFLKEALGKSGLSVLVHCHAGVSRSAAVITSYLMHTSRLSLEDACSRLQALKTDIKMNEEFLGQLSLYEAMGCDVDMTCASYKQYRLQKVTEKYPELRKLPQEVFASDPCSMAQTAEVLYRCRKCRRSLFREGSILNHALGTGTAAFAHKRLPSIQKADTTKCTSYFVEPVQWMAEALLGVMDGQLLCPKCSSKLGSFNWYGVQCSCGRWVTPAFQIHKNRVDEAKNRHIRGIQQSNT
ncbi:dual specificity phosphatase 12 L homeolog [Xenopus laevis]|uniref:Dual specificity protein phosphatase 12 n=1 Tax=Xenopus laevis TaxID=8355 RepID=Q0IH89_XENLA|nr:dual specificity phosphatase 12 L homeolog [Xenopus laevis]AAI23262.1 Dusp12 protein [Xenopus laevis]